MSSVSTNRRKSAPKVRTGCIICKARHIRCDETKPRCSPCRKSFRHCEYLAGQMRSGPQHLKIIMWQPKGLALQRLSPDPSHTYAESRGFEFFRTKVAEDLDGLVESNFWTTVVLRAAQCEPSVYHAVIALASLSESILHAKRDPQHQNDPQKARERMPKTFAVQQHNKAITSLNKRMQETAESRSSAVVVLITCVLFICFANFQNDADSMLRQMSSGIHIFFDYFVERAGDSQVASPWSIDCSCKMSQQIQQTFRRLMQQTILFVDMKPGEWEFLSPAFTPAKPMIPGMFKSITQARTCLESCQCYLYHRMLTAHFCKINKRQNCRSPRTYGLNMNDGLLRQWVLAFEALMSAQKRKFSPRQHIEAMLLETEYLTACILVATGVSNPETVFDTFEDDFCRIIDLASRIMSTSDRWRSKYTEIPLPAFDTNMLPPLYFVASRCRHPLIRRQALELLRQGPYQEGYWHRGILSSIAERIMNLEERHHEGAKSSADIPESARISVLNTTVNSAELVLVLHCCQQQPGEIENPLFFEERISY